MARTPELHGSETHRRGFWTYSRGKIRYLGRHRGRALREVRLLQASRPIDGEPATVSEAVTRWLSEHPGEWHEDMCDLWVTVAGRKPLQGLTTTHYRDVVRAMKGKRSPQTIRHVLSHVGQVLRWCRDRGWIATVPAPLGRGEIPKVQSNPKDLQTGSLGDLFADLDGHERTRPAAAICRFMYFTGCRPDEACCLEWSAVNLEAGTCTLVRHKTVDRTGDVRTIYLTSQARAVLMGVRGRRGVVFLNSTGGPFTPGGLRSVLRRRGMTGAYQLRHSFAQQSLEQTSMENVAKLLGHKDLRMVQRYAQVRDARARRVAGTLELPLPAGHATRRTAQASAGPPERPGTRKQNRRKRASG